MKLENPRMSIYSNERNAAIHRLYLSYDLIYFSSHTALFLLPL